MSPRAYAYVATVLLAGATLGVHAVGMPPQTPAPWALVALLIGLATVAQLFKAEAPNHVLFYASPVFFFAGALLLPPGLLVPLIVIPHVIEWARERWRHSRHLRAWYLQPFNMAMYTIAALGANAIATTLSAVVGHSAAVGDGGTSWSLVTVLLAALGYLIANTVLLGTALALARGVSWRESGVLDVDTLLLDSLLVCVGATLAVVWHANPWMLPLTLAPLVLIYRALLIPQLKRDAQTDAKTGLASARHLNGIFSAELDRAARFGRPLAVLMADLDHFKAVNDTYGHLAGDAVLAAVGQLIRATLRDYDIAGRFGGEEFMIVLPEVGEAEARAFAERLRHVVEKAEIAAVDGAAPLHVTLSVGVACFPAHGTTTTALTEAADMAVYRAKAAGRNCVACVEGDEPSIPMREAV